MAERFSLLLACLACLIIFGTCLILSPSNSSDEANQDYDDPMTSASSTTIKSMEEMAWEVLRERAEGFPVDGQVSKKDMDRFMRGFVLVGAQMPVPQFGRALSAFPPRVMRFVLIVPIVNLDM